MGYTGTIEKMWLNIDDVISITSDDGTATPLIDLAEGNNPYFTIVGYTTKPPERKITVIDAKFKGFSIDFALTDNTMISREFDALDIMVK